MRQSWNLYFINIAKTVSSRSTCNRKKVGAVIVRDKDTIISGYNGSLPGLEHCEDVGCLIENNHCISTCHAEASAIARAAKNGISVNNTKMYITAFPCWNCFKLIVSAGVREVYYLEKYNVDPLILKYAKKCGVRVCQLKEI